MSFTTDQSSLCFSLLLYRGLEAVKASERIYLEAYTSLLLVPKETLEEFYGKPVIVADREMVEMVRLGAFVFVSLTLLQHPIYFLEYFDMHRRPMKY
jgi:hypothetical protein